MIRINKNLALFSGLLLLLGTTLFFTFQKLSPLIGHFTYYCQSLLIGVNMIPIPYYLSIIPFALLLLILTFAVIKFCILNINVHFFKLKLDKNAVVYQNIEKLINRLGLKGKTILVHSETQFAFCLGVRAPKIYFSTGLLSKLSIKELEAVLRHEQYHLENHDTFTMMVASITRSLFPFFPLLSDLIKKYRIDREINADKFAVSKMGHQYPLISALKKLLAFPTVETVSMAAIADYDTLEPRIYSLMNKRHKKRQFRLRHLIITLFSSLIVGAILIMPVHAQELHHEEHDVVMLCAEGAACMYSCTSEKNLNKLYSDVPTTQNMIHQSFLLPYSPARQ
jgi:beta-lactamase regulating signal transducer with metallopeptidase domain